MKHLLVVADDFGYGIARDQGLVKCFQAGAVSALSLLAHCKHSNDAVNLAKNHNIPVGLHFNLTEGLPLAPRHTVASLIGKDGKFLGKQQFWANENIEPKHVKVELKAQIKWFENNFGRPPFRIDGHQHVHVHGNVSEVFSRTLSECGIKSTRLPVEHTASRSSCETSPQRELFHSLIENCALKTKLTFAEHCVQHTEAFLGLNFMGNAMDTDRLQTVIKSVFDSGVSSCELMCHPGFICDKSEDGFVGNTSADIFSCSPDREHELKILTSPEMLQFYQDEDISLCAKSA
uniref:Carbohydrate deacetylase n=1 Tax=Phallusia mammillata TaxID=59560 RepID=A0A6F9DXT3_9ASCI|nr:UPF0249 protein ydjC homolog [Phallusia mammillata]